MEEAMVPLGATASVRIYGVDASRAAVPLAFAVALAIGGGVFGQFHLADPGGRAGLETSIMLGALLSIGLLAAHFQYGRRRQDLLLLCAVAAAAGSDFFFSALPALAGTGALASDAGARLTSEVIVGVAFAAAAFAPDRAVARGGRRLVLLAGASAIGVVAVAELVDVLSGGLPAAIPQIHLAEAAHPPLALTVHVLVSGSLLIAGSAFFLRSRPGDTDASLLAGAALLLSTVTLQSATTPVPADGWVTFGGILRLLAYALLLAVAARRYLRTRQAMASAAISDERRRIARDLHDGLAQDLALIAAHSQRLDSELGPDHPLTIAARHALAASRGAIVDLTASQAPSTAAALREVASELALRFQVQVNVSTELGRAQHEAGDLHSAAREEIVRIAREAIANAAQHGGAHRVDVVLERSGRHVRLRVSDDGCGIAENVAPSAGGFGLPTMRARAEALGGRLTARRRPYGGTELEVRVSSGLDGATARGGSAAI